MNIFGKKIGNLLSIVFNGKPSTITPETPEKMDEMVDLLKKANGGDEAATAELGKHLKKSDEEKLPEFKQKVDTLKNNVQTTENKIAASQIITNLKDNPLFDVVETGGDVKYFLKGFKAEMPMSLVEKFAEMIGKGEDIKDLVSFWMLNLANDNPDARRGLYKYLTKQKLMVMDGYFITFRRLFKVKNTTVKSGEFVTEAKLAPFIEKAKKWRQSKKAFEIYQDTTEKVLVMQPIKNHEKNSKNHAWKFLGTLHDCFENLKLATANSEEIEQTYTDAHTRTMIVKLNQPVRQHRSKCDSNPKKDCSFGLHVGVPGYVSGSSSLGDTIVACLINPLHVVSVPYSDAQKMRVCEYYPFMEITEDQLKNFDKVDISEFVKNYKKIEQEDLKRALEVIDDLSPAEKKEFSINKTYSTPEEIDQLMKDLEKQRAQLATTQASVGTLLNDDISKSLDVEEVKAIINARLAS